MYVCWVGLVLYEGVMGLYVLYLLCYAKGIYELREGLFGVIDVGVIVWMCFIWGYMWVYEGDLIWSGVLYCWGERGDYIGLGWNLGGWLGGVLGEIGGLWLD